MTEREARVRACPICGKEFYSTSSQAIYCSEKCRKEGKRRNRKKYADDITAYEERKKKELRLAREAAAARAEAARKAKEREKRCPGCVWKSPGERICVMPRCMLVAFAERKEDGNANTVW